jgi:nucleoside-diphosphate-sugar epimerase
MRALVTGGAGFIGSALARGLLAEGWEVRVLDNLLTGSSDRVPAQAELVEGDLRDRDAVAGAVRGAEVVFHHAALRSVPRSVDDPELSHACNATGTLHVAMACAEEGVRRLIYASSSSVYGDLGEGRNQEDLRPDPRSPYAASKLTGEHYCAVWARMGGAPSLALRYFNVFGPGQNPESRYSAVFPAFVSALLDGRPPEVHWDGQQERDFTYVEDVVRANLAAAAVGPEVNGAVVNVAGGRPRSVNEVLRAVADAVGSWIEPLRTERRPGDIRRTEADVSRARDLLGWEPRVRWEDAVEATVEWFRAERGAPAERASRRGGS